MTKNKRSKRFLLSAGKPSVLMLNGIMPSITFHIVMLNVNMLGLAILIVIMLSATIPFPYTAGGAFKSCKIWMMRPSTFTFSITIRNAMIKRHSQPKIREERVRNKLEVWSSI
jgi:hypothetical protein